MVNFYTAKKKINGKEYTAQFNGISAALKAVDDSYIEGTNNTSVEKLSKYLFEHVIVDPKGLTPDDFDSMDEFNEVITADLPILLLLLFHFIEKKEQKSNTKASKE